jgi:hypothetical protein
MTMDYLAISQSWTSNIWLDMITIAVSVFAVVYWIRLFRKIYIAGEGDEGWLWVFSSILLVLLLNLATLFLNLASGRFSISEDVLFVMSPDAASFVLTFSRMVMALSLSVGTYMLYDFMSRRGDVKFGFCPVTPAAEDMSQSKQRYQLATGTSYLIAGSAQHSSLRGVEVFTDLVTHGVMGFCATRDYPQRLRQKYGLMKTPMVWLTQEKAVEDGIHPADLAELSHMIKDFISRGGDTVVLLDGLEYLILHNSFEDILKVVQGLNDVVVQHESRLLVTVDPSALSEQQFHLLSRELTAFPGIQ